MDVEIEQAVRSAVGRAAQESRDFTTKRLDDLGWTELLEADEATATKVFFEEQGRLLLSSSALDSVVVRAMGGGWSWPSARVGYPLPGRTSADAGPGTDVEALVFSRDEFDVALVAVDTGSGIVVHSVAHADAVLNPVDGMDETLGLSRLTAKRADLVPAERTDWSAGLAAGRRALAHELLGVSRQMLDIVVEHVSTREQFGHPLGVNQVIQHRLADARVDLEAADMICDESWNTATTFAAATAKAQAGNAFNLTAQHGQQFLGGIGYTWEHHWRHHVRRGFVLSVLLGASDECESEIAATLLANGVVRLGNLV